MATIRLQQFGRFLWPADAMSEKVLEEEFEIGRIPCGKFYFHSPKIIKRGHRMAILGNVEDIV